MKNYLKLFLPIIVMIGVFALVGASSASAITLQEGAEAARCDQCPRDLFGNTGVFKQITNTILYIVGIIAVVMLIVGGIKYLLSGGDSKKVTDAKNTVLYAIIGLVIAFLAYAIVNFVITALPSSAEENTTSLINTAKG
ncbi:MAG: pilin [Candidatus Saccharibacteria bacterium]|nr:pilin [Candidatus Saccharibacteria bacterium]